MVGDASKLLVANYLLASLDTWDIPLPFPETKSSHLKMDGILVFFWGPANFQGRTVHPNNWGRCLLYPFWWTRRLFSSRCVETKSWKSMWTAKMDFAETRYFWTIAVSLVGKILRDREMDGRAASVETDDMTHIRHIHGGKEHNHTRAVLARKLPKAKISGPGTGIQHTLHLYPPSQDAGSQICWFIQVRDS